jgi:hypothetical protein
VFIVVPRFFVFLKAISGAASLLCTGKPNVSLNYHCLPEMLCLSESMDDVLAYIPVINKQLVAPTLGKASNLIISVDGGGIELRWGRRRATLHSDLSPV